MGDAEDRKCFRDDLSEVCVAHETAAYLNYRLYRWRRSVLLSVDTKN